MAILRKEPDADDFLQWLAAADAVSMSAGSWIELGSVLTRTATPEMAAACDAMFDRLRIVIVAVTVRQATLARDAYRRFGRGSGHPARLNFGDCFAYALAKESGEPLLFKGDDFSHTDVASALA